MNWSDSTLWWVVTGALVAAELTTGTFYLLMLALGAASAALAAMANAGFVAQLVVAAAVGGGAVVAWHMQRARHEQRRKATPDVTQLDVGEHVVVPQWDAHGNARVQYRGSTWDARHAGHGSPEPGEHVIRAVEGNRLLLEKKDK